MSEAHVESDQLLAHAHFMRSLAHSLLNDRARVDDVVQDVFVTALTQQPPRRFELRAWLAVVVRNAARLTRRRDERRARREHRAARDEALPGAFEDAQRLELMRTVIAAVERLEPPYRSVVLLRFYDELPPRRIAAELGVPVNTVRTRLQRALGRLREDLGSTRDRGDRDGLTALGLLFAPHGATLAAGQAAAVLTGAIVMSAKVKIAAAVVLLAAAAASWWTWQLETSRPRAAKADQTSESAAHDAEASPTRAVDTLPSPTRTDSEHRDELAPAAASTPVGTIRLHGRLVADPGQLARWQTAIRVTPLVEVREGGGLFMRPSKNVATTTCAVDADGRFACELAVAAPPQPDVRLLTLDGDDPHFRDFTRDVPVPRVPIDHPLELETEIRVFPIARITGKVVDESGRPVAAAAVALVPVESGSPEHAAEDAVDETMSDAQGSFSLRVLFPQDFFVVATGITASAWRNARTGSLAPGARLRPGHVRVRLDGGNDRDIGEVVLREGASIRGHVRTNGSDPAAGTVVAAWRLPSEALLNGRLVSPLYPRDVETGYARVCPDSNGDFELAGLGPGPWNVGFETIGAARLDADASQRSTVTVTAPSDGVELASHGARIVFEVRADGRPLPNVGLRVQCGTALLSWGDYLSTDDAGHAVVLLAPGRQGVACVTRWDPHDGATCVTFVAKTEPFTAPGEGEELVVPIKMMRNVPREVLRLKLVAPDGSPINRAGMVFTCEDPGYEGADKSCLIDEFADDGILRVSGRKPGHWRIQIRPDGSFRGGDGLFAQTVREVDLDGEHVVDLEIHVEPAARLRVAAVDRDGRRLPARFQLRDAHGEKIPIEVSTMMAGVGRGDGRLAETMALQTRTIGCLELPENTVELPSGDVGHVDPPLPPGHYEATFHVQGYRTQIVPVELRAGECKYLEIIFDRG